MRKRSASHDLGTFPIPSPGGGPLYRGSSAAAGFQKGWASERVPPPPGRQIVSSSAATAFNSGRAVPSKWEDAERWICSPMNGKGLVVTSHSHHHQPPKRPKSKSGPIVQFSTAAAAMEGGSLMSLPASSPFSTGVLAADSVYCTSNGVGPLCAPDWPDFKGSNYCCPSPKSLSSESKEEAIESALSRQRDVATQMSPSDCECSRRSSRSTVERSSSEVRDVEVDKRATTIRWSKKRGIRMTKRPQPRHLHDFARNDYAISETAMDNSKWKREEAKIIAWENLQKAKAEAAIRKLEMKLEKKRSTTMDKIVEKLRTAEFRAHKMRSDMSDDQITDNTDPFKLLKTPRKLFSFRKHIRMGSLSRLLMCRAF